MRRPCSRHQRSCAALRVGTRNPGPGNASAAADRFAAGELGVRRGSNDPAGNLPRERRAGHAAERLARIETELRVQRQRTVVKRGLHQSHASKLRSSREDVLHQKSPGARVLQLRVDGDRTNPRDLAALVEHVAAEHHAVALRHHHVEAGVGDHHRQHADTHFRARDVRREVVRLVDRAERFVADAPAALGVFGSRLSQCHRHRHFSRGSRIQQRNRHGRSLAASNARGHSMRISSPGLATPS